MSHLNSNIAGGMTVWRRGIKGSFTPNDYITVAVTFMGGTFDHFDSHSDGYNGLHNLFARQGNVVA